MLWLAGVDQSGCCLCGDVTAVGNIEGVTAHLSTPNYGGIEMSHWLVSIQHSKLTLLRVHTCSVRCIRTAVPVV